jgi:hypothetical protein
LGWARENVLRGIAANKPLARLMRSLGKDSRPRKATPPTQQPLNGGLYSIQVFVAIEPFVRRQPWDRGIARERTKNGFRYRQANGRLVRDPATLQRVRAVVIPPAWEEVWICPTATGHIQA